MENNKLKNGKSVGNEVEDIVRWLRKVLNKKDVKVNASVDRKSFMTVVVEHRGIIMKIVVSEESHLSFLDDDFLYESRNKDEVIKVFEVLLSYFNALAWEVMKIIDFITEYSESVRDELIIEWDKKGHLKSIKCLNIKIKRKDKSIVVKDSLCRGKFIVREYNDEFDRLLYRNVEALVPSNLFRLLNETMDKIDKEIVD